MTKEKKTTKEPEMLKKQEEEKLKDKALDILEKVNNKTFEKMVMWSFGEAFLGEQIVKMIKDDWDVEILKDFIREFGKKK